MSDAFERVLVITAHPDDPEFLAGGTVVILARQGAEVTYVIVTNGSKGSSDPGVTPERLARMRQAEQRQAAAALGATRVNFLGYEDGELEDTRQLRLDVTREIRRWRPDLVITQNPQRTFTSFPGWHRDRITGGVVLDCIYPLARDRLAFPELLPQFEPHTVREIYLVQWDAPRLVIDIRDVMETKLRAIACHASQVSDFSAVEARMRRRASLLGQPKGLTYAEGFDHITVAG
jgi:LmbE family N-acetylglucosaminyl deacetylase